MTHLYWSLEVVKGDRVPWSNTVHVCVPYVMGSRYLQLLRYKQLLARFKYYLFKIFIKSYII